MTGDREDDDGMAAGRSRLRAILRPSERRNSSVGAAAALRRRDEVRAAKAQGAKALAGSAAGALANVGRQQTLSHEEIARRSLEEAKLAGEEVSEAILRRAPAAAPVAAPADDSIPEERLSQTRFSSQDSLAA